MGRNASLLIVLYFVGTVIVGGYAGNKWQKYDKDHEKKNKSLTCYVCNSLYDPRCGDPFDSYSLGFITCADRDVSAHLLDMKPVVCRKTVQVVQGKTRVIRDCGYIPDKYDDKQCVRRTGTHEVVVEYCSCTTSLCNTAPWAAVPNITTFAFALLSILLLFVFRRA